MSSSATQAETDYTPSSFHFPTRSGDWLKTVIVGSVLLVLSPLVLPAFAVVGHLMRVLRAGADAALMAPTFGDWGALLVDGARGTVVTVVYWLVPALLIVNHARVAAVVGSGQPTIAAIIAVTIPVVYPYPAALANLAIEGSLRSALDPRALWRLVGTREYFDSWAYTISIEFVFIAAAIFLQALAVIGVFFQFYFLVVLMYDFGRTYDKITERSSA